MLKLAKFLSILLLVVAFSFQTFIRAGNFSSFFYQLTFNSGKIELKKTELNRINVLLLGIGGGKHDGPNLTDTIILASLDTKAQKITLVSLPRDMWVDDLKGRINTAYVKGEKQKKGGGLALAKSVVRKVTNQQVDYAIVIDFSGFVKAVDLMGGIDVPVDRTFDDFEYPIEGEENNPCENKEEDLEKLATASSQLEAFPCRYQKVHFDKGLSHMDGETALKFVRSRHAKGVEGTDFARSQRQEKVINAFRDKVFSLQILVNPTKVIGLYETVRNSVDTDIKQNEFDDFIKLAQKLQKAETQSVVIDFGDSKTGRKGLLVHPPISKDYNFEWTLIPRTGKNSFEEIQEYIRCQIAYKKCMVSELTFNFINSRFSF